MRLRYSAVLLLLAPLALSACESTQSESARLEAEGANLVKTKTIDVGAANRKIEVLDKTVITDQYGSVVVVQLENKSDQGLADAPIAINVKDKSGKSVYRNNSAGVETGLIQVPVIKPKDEFYWVNDQVLATGVPASVDVKVGEAPKQLPDELPQIDVSEPRIKVDPTSGIEATGTASNKSDIEQTDLVLYAIASKNGKVVAAGRGLIPKLKVGGKPETYHIFFIGNPAGAEVTVIAPPVTLE